MKRTEKTAAHARCRRLHPGNRSSSVRLLALLVLLSFLRSSPERHTHTPFFPHLTAPTNQTDSIFPILLSAYAGGLGDDAGESHLPAGVSGETFFAENLDRLALDADGAWLPEVERTLRAEALPTHPRNEFAKVRDIQEERNSMEIGLVPETSSYLDQLEKNLQKCKDDEQGAVVAKIAQHLVPQWRNVPESELRTTLLPGGLTNKLYKVEFSPEESRPCTGGEMGVEECAGTLLPQHVDKFPARVLFRVFGQPASMHLFEPETEKKLFRELSNQGIAPTCIGECGGGRIEKWVDGEALNVEELSLMSVLKSLMKKLADFHAVKVDTGHLDPNSSAFQNCPWRSFLGASFFESKASVGLQPLQQQLVPVASQGSVAGAVAVSESHNHSHDNEEKCVCMFCRARHWAQLASAAREVAIQAALPDEVDKNVDTADNAVRRTATNNKMHQLNLEFYMQKIMWLQNVVMYHIKNELEPANLKRVYGDVHTWRLLSGASPVLSHNDLQENNIMKNGNLLTLIDFEYAGTNLRANDLGNIFCEMAIDYMSEHETPYFRVNMKNYPNQRMRREIIRKYLTAVAMNDPRLKERLEAEEAERLAIRKARPRRLLEPQKLLISQEVISNFEMMAIWASLFSHLQWALWSVVKATPLASPNGFDYIEYANARLNFFDSQMSLLKESIFGDYRFTILGSLSRVNPTDDLVAKTAD